MRASVSWLWCFLSLVSRRNSIVFIMNKEQQQLTNFFHFTLCRVWAPVKTKSKRLTKKGSKQVSAASLDADDDDDDDETLIPAELLSDNVPLPELSMTHRVKYQLPLRTVTVKKTINTTVSLKIEQDVGKQNRQVIFESSEKVSEFINAIRQEKDMETNRLNAKIKATLTGVRLKTGEKLDLLIEIVSGWNLPIADVSSSDPFVICSINGREVHRTKYISKT